MAAAPANEANEDLVKARKELEGVALAIGFVRRLLDESEGDVITGENGSISRGELEDKYREVCGELEDAATEFFRATVRATPPGVVTNDDDGTGDTEALSAAAD